MINKKFFKVSALCLGCIGMTGMAMADDSNKDNVFTLGEIVVEDSSGVRDIAINNTVTAEEIKEIGATNAAEALEYVPGVNVVQTAKGAYEINIQGFGQQYILILIDGVPYYETKNGPLDLQQIPASIIGKIEVTKGASSVLYGPNALGGVVNIITKKGVKGFTGSVSTELGRDGYNRDVATLNYGAENGFSVLGTIDYKRRDALHFSNDYEPVPSDINPEKGPSSGKANPRIIDDGDKKDNSDLESLNLWTRLGYAPTDKAEIYASLYHFEMEKGRPFSDSHNKVLNFPDGYSSFGRYNSYEDMGIDIGGKFEVNDWLAFRALAFYHKHEDEYSSYLTEDLSQKIATSTWDDDSYGASLFSDIKLGENNTLSLTTQYREDKHKDRDDFGLDYVEYESNIVTIAAEDTHKFGQLTAVIGLSYNYFDVKKAEDLPGYTTDTLDPMIGLTWAGESGLELFGSIAQKTRFPVFADMEADGIIYSLDPEKNINYTIGAKYNFFDTTQASLSFYYNDVSDKIADGTDGAGNDTKVNLDSVEIYGIELSTNTTITDRLNFGFDYNYTHARNTSSGVSPVWIDKDTPYEYLEDIPEHMFIGRIGYIVPYIESRFSIAGTYKIDTLINEEKMFFEDSFVVDMSLVKDFDNGFTVGGYIYNLLDADYYEGNGMACNGFNFKVMAQYQF